MMNIADRKIAAVELPGIPSDRAGISAPGRAGIVGDFRRNDPFLGAVAELLFLLGGALGKIVGKQPSGRLADARDEANHNPARAERSMLPRLAFKTVQLMSGKPVFSTVRSGSGARSV